MEALSPTSPVQRVVLMFASQLAKSEIGNNALGFYAHRDPGPMLMTQPTDRDLKDYVRQRLRPMIRDTPALRSRISQPKSRDGDNTLQGVSFPGGFLRTVTGNSAAALRSTPVRILFLDEIDGYPLDVDGEGDPIDLACQRTVTFSRRKILLTSTPTIKGKSRIESEYEASDRRRFWVPCPHCGEFQILKWVNVQWEKGDPRSAVYVCELGCVIHNHEKSQILPLGEWRAESPGAQGGTVRGYHLNALYAPHGLGPTFGDCAAQFVEAKHAKDPARLQAFINLKLGETWSVADGESIESEGLLALRESWDPPRGREGLYVPGGCVLTCGVDVQDNRFELEVVSWGPGFESWSADYRILPCDPSTKEAWRDLDELIRRSFWHVSGERLKISATCLDTQGHYTDAAYRFVKPRERRGVYGIAGKAGDRPIWPIRASKNNKGRINLRLIGVDAAKAHVYDRLKIRAMGPGYCHFPDDRDPAYFDQLTAEVYRTRWKAGRKVTQWSLKRAGLRNEALDCRVYAYAALMGWISRGKTLEGESDRLAVRIENRKNPSVGAKVTPPPRRKPRGADWINPGDFWGG